MADQALPESSSLDEKKSIPHEIVQVAISVIKNYFNLHGFNIESYNLGEFGYYQMQPIKFFSGEGPDPLGQTYISEKLKITLFQLHPLALTLQWEELIMEKNT